MGRFDRRARHSGRLCLVTVALAGLCLFWAGCGGGTAADIQPPPPREPDFALTLSSSIVSITQGSTSPAISIGVTPKNGFTGQVDVTLGALPSGVTANPASPFSVSVGLPISLLLTASSTPPPGPSIFTLPVSFGLPFPCLLPASGTQQPARSISPLRVQVEASRIRYSSPLQFKAAQPVFCRGTISCAQIQSRFRTTRLGNRIIATWSSTQRVSICLLRTMLRIPSK